MTGSAILLVVATLWTQSRTDAPFDRAAARLRVKTVVDTTAAAAADTMPVISVAAAEHRFKLRVQAVPNTVTVGQHFALTVTVQVPTALAKTVKFPNGVDSISQTQTSSFGLPTRRVQTMSGGMVEESATYQLAAWNIGAVQVGLGEMVVGTTRVNLSDPVVTVRSVLPKDPVALARVQPKVWRTEFPVLMIIRRFFQRSVQQVKQDNRLLVAVIIAVLLLIGAGVALWIRARRRRLANAPFDWLAWAEGEFRRIDALHLLERGAPEQYAILMTDALRKTLVHQFPNLRESATTLEMVSALQREPTIPAQRTLALFERVDVLKFAGRESDIVDAQKVGHEDRDILREIKERSEAERLAREAEEAARRERQRSGRETVGVAPPTKSDDTTGK